jgi:hypothetical protein
VSFGSSSGAPKALALFDSASAMVQALARSLEGRDFRRLGMPLAMRPFAAALNALPMRAGTRAYAWAGAAEGISTQTLRSVDADELYGWAAGLFPGRYPSVAIGSSNGAATHLCAALGIPWLPQTLLILVRRRTPEDEPRKDLEWSCEPAARFLANNPDIQIHHMNDPNQDRLMVRYQAYFRIKRRSLGKPYERFLSRSLAPGGTVILIECTKRWPTHAAGERHVFQMGAVGGATPEEYLEGGPRVEEFLRRMGSDRTRWHYPEPDADRPEAEWGFEESLREDVLRFASRNGFRVQRLVFEDPEDLSDPVADFYRRWYRRIGWDGNRVFLSSFMLLDPHLTVRSGSVPFWTKFSVESSADSAERFLKEEPFDEVLLTLFPHGVDSIGMAGVERWREVARHARRRYAFVGVDTDRFPRDFTTAVRFQDGLARFADRPVPERLPLSAWVRHLEEAGDRYRVRYEDLARDPTDRVIARPGTSPWPGALDR